MVSRGLARSIAPGAVIGLPFSIDLDHGRISRVAAALADPIG